jgi:hypothetical protein
VRPSCSLYIPSSLIVWEPSPQVGLRFAIALDSLHYLLGCAGDRVFVEASLAMVPGALQSTIVIPWRRHNISVLYVALAPDNAYELLLSWDRFSLQAFRDQLHPITEYERTIPRIWACAIGERLSEWRREVSSPLSQSKVLARASVAHPFAQVYADGRRVIVDDGLRALVLVHSQIGNVWSATKYGWPPADKQPVSLATCESLDALLSSMAGAFLAKAPRDQRLDHRLVSMGCDYDQVLTRRQSTIVGEVGSTELITSGKQ